MTPVTLDTYAQILARLACRRGVTVASVLAELGVTAEDLARDEPGLRAQLREAWPRRKGVAAMKFAAAIGDELEKLTLLGAPAEETPAAPVVQVPSAMLGPAAGAGPSRWVAQAPSYVAAAPHPAAPAPTAPAAAEPAPPPLHRPQSFGTTAPYRADPAGTAAMPFAAPAASPAVVEAPPGPQEPRAPALGSGTVALGQEVAAPPLPPGVVELTVRQYASLRVDLQLTPAHAAAILERYRIAPNGREALDAYWRVRFEADPLLRMEFARAYAEYVSWLKANPGA